MKCSGKRRVRQAAAVFVILCGVLLTFYPCLSNYLFEHRVDSTVESYRGSVSTADREDIEEVRRLAEQYNRELTAAKISLSAPFTAEKETGNLRYEDMLDLDGSGLMCFVEIPRIRVHLPVYHGTGADALEKGAGHIEGTSLPVGGVGNHAVLSAHTGINSSKMFTDLTELEEGDLFFLQVLGERMAYRVKQIRVIRPDDVSRLMPQEEKDLVSLLTCTPYGVNTHRLVVTGERTEYTEQICREAEEEPGVASPWLDHYGKALMLGTAVTGMGAGAGWLVGKNRRRKGRRNHGKKGRMAT